MVPDLGGRRIVFLMWKLDVHANNYSLTCLVQHWRNSQRRMIMENCIDVIKKRKASRGGGI